MTNQIRSSRRQIKLPGKYNDHIMGNSSQRDVEDKHEDMDKNGVDQENNIGVKKVMGNNELNGARKDQYGKMNQNEKSANIQVNSNANCSNNYVIIDNEGEEGDKSNGNNHKSVTYAKMVGQDEVPKTLSYIPTLTTDDGVEVVVFDEMLVKKGSERWNVTICGQFVGFQMHISEMRYNIVLEKGPWMVKNKSLMVNRRSPNIGMQKIEPKKLPVWIKMFNVPLEAWSVEGLSALASSVGKPILMDTITANMCHTGNGRFEFARVLIEMDAGKVFKTEIEVQYRDNENMVKGVKKVQVLYDWKPPVCSKC
ncbi:zinc knuckle CX2CX4HX4C containing protein, partial [Tanacetum coccineum]